jgi:hypothetical protein
LPRCRGESQNEPLKLITQNPTYSAASITVAAHAVPFIVAISASPRRDFTASGEWDAAVTWQRIEEIFGVGGAEVGSERLVDILVAIAERRRVQ